RRAFVDRRSSRYAGQPPARFFEEDLHRREVPGLEIDLDVDLGLALRDETVAVVVTEATRRGARIHQPDEAVPVSGLAEDAEAGGGDGGRAQGGRVGGGDPLAVAERALTFPGGVEVAGDRVIDDAGRDFTALLERDQNGPDRDMSHEVPGAVDRVDDPADVPR